MNLHMQIRGGSPSRARLNVNGVTSLKIARVASLNENIVYIVVKRLQRRASATSATVLRERNDEAAESDEDDDDDEYVRPTRYRPVQCN